nr:immunoglobulin heavy chain junction region [Mus musculus]
CARGGRLRRLYYFDYW